MSAIVPGPRWVVRVDGHSGRRFWVGGVQTSIHRSGLGFVTITSLTDRRDRAWEWLTPREAHTVARGLSLDAGAKVYRRPRHVPPVSK